MNVWGKLGLFAGGALFGTAGVKVLSSRDAKKVYAHTTAAALRVKECVMTTVTKVKENTEDILADAKAINDQRDDGETEEILDTSAEETEETEESAE